MLLKDTTIEMHGEASQIETLLGELEGKVKQAQRWPKESALLQRLMQLLRNQGNLAAQAERTLTEELHKLEEEAKGLTSK